MRSALPELSETGTRERRRRTSGSFCSRTRTSRTGPNSRWWLTAFEFYCHPDHPQSTGYVTDQTGRLQHDEYLPRGEVWIQEALNKGARNIRGFGLFEWSLSTSFA